MLTVGLRRPVFWLVSRPELKSYADLEGKAMGTITLGGSQHTAGIRLLRKTGLNPDKDLTVVLGGERADSAAGFGQWLDPSRYLHRRW